MTDKDILKAAIEKAVQNGWDASLIAIDRDNKEAYDYWLQLAVGSQSLYRAVIFDHGFARAFFGEKMTDIHQVKGWVCLHEWQIWLREMVIEQYPLQYLDKFLYSKQLQLSEL